MKKKTIKNETKREIIQFTNGKYIYKKRRKSEPFVLLNMSKIKSSAKFKFLVSQFIDFSPTRTEFRTLTDPLISVIFQLSIIAFRG